MKLIGPQLLWSCPPRLLTVGLLYVLSVSAQTANSQGSYSNRSVAIVQPTDATFDDALDANFSGIRVAPGFDRIKPFLVVVQNNTSHGILAYVVTWTLNQSDGSSRNLYFPAVHEAHPAVTNIMRQTLSGEEIVLSANQMHLVCPFFYWGRSMFPAFASRAANELTWNTEVFYPRMLNNAAGAKAFIDVIFDDGVFLGSDVSGLYERYQKEQQGQIYESAQVLDLLKADNSDQQIALALSVDVKAGAMASGGTDLNSFYSSARGREARRLLGILKGKGGRTSLQAVVVSVSKAKPTIVNRQAEQ
jgi:hypothetical protein